LRLRPSATFFFQQNRRRRVDFRHLFAYRIPVTQGNEAPGKIIYLGACLIAAVRLAREEKWDNSPRVVNRIADAINLARRIYERMRRDFQWKD